MAKQPTPANAYLPNRSHNYYPIEPKKASQEQNIPPTTLRV
jgi:hypothetical protein